MHLPRHCDIWLPGYLHTSLRQGIAQLARGSVRRVWVMIADHFEPLCLNASEEQAISRVAAWRRRWPEIATRHADSTGRHPVYTFFYPEEEYRPQLLDALAEMAEQKIADVEVHIHHDGEGERDFVERIDQFIAALAGRHGLLREEDGRIRFGFIHGNWALDNSLPGGRWCGLDHEIRVLRDLGCYADFTMPTGASPSQSRMVNRIYWAASERAPRKSYDRGTPLEDRSEPGDLMIIPGPFTLRWRRRLTPRLEKGELAVYDMPTQYRVRRWLAAAPRIGTDVFIKLYGHGAQERNMFPLLGTGLTALFEVIDAERRRLGFDLHYVSAWQMYRAVLAVSRGLDPVIAARPAAISMTGAL